MLTFRICKSLLVAWLAIKFISLAMKWIRYYWRDLEPPKPRKENKRMSE